MDAMKKQQVKIIKYCTFHSEEKKKKGKKRAENGFLYDYEKLLRTPVPFSADEAVELCECDE